jgi:hypothetical protein
MKHTLSPNHFILTPENPVVPGIQNPSIEDATKFLNQSGENAEIVQGHYDKPERSILIHNPKNVQGLHEMAKQFGQESAIHSQNGKHEMHFYHGPNAGKIVKGSGTQFYKEKPENYYTTIHTNKGPLHFSHNFDFNKSEKLDKGLRGDWKSEGYTIHHATLDPNDNEGWDALKQAFQNRHGFLSYKSDDNKEHMLDSGFENDRDQIHNAHKMVQLNQAKHDNAVKHPFIYAKDKNGNYVGSMSYSGDEVVKNFVLPEHQRKGISNAMHKQAPYSTTLTPDGQALWNQSNRPFGKSEDLKKGAVKRLYPFDPASVPHDERRAVEEWQDMESASARENIPEMHPNAKARALHKLHAKTKVRRNPATNQREYFK